MTLMHPIHSRTTQPTWEIALLYPEQGNWTEDDYLDLTESTNRLVELSGGHLEVLPMPKTSHQLIVQYLHGLLLAFVQSRKLGTVLFAPLRVRLWGKTFREPDIVFMLAKNARRIGEDFWQGADLVMEIVSGRVDDRKRDLVTKKREYAKAGIAEYWIVDPKEQRITVLKLKANRYVVHANGSEKGAVGSALLAGFAVRVENVLAVGVGR
jgi:Uma2 family endonuclease